MRLIDVPSALEPPTDIVERLQRIDPGVTLYYEGLGLWLLGRVKSDAQRRHIGIRTLDLLHRACADMPRTTFVFYIPASAWDRWKDRHVPRWLRWLIPIRKTRHTVQSLSLPEPFWPDEQRARLMMAGFGLIATMPGPIGGEVVEEFRRSLWLSHHTAETEQARHFHRQLHHDAEREAGQARTREFIQTEGRMHHRRIMRHQLSLRVSGLRKE